MRRNFMKSILLSAAMTLMFVPLMPVSAENETDITNDALPNKPYALPYTFDEFLAVSDDAFYENPEIPQEVKEDYQQLRKYDKMVPLIRLQFTDEVKIRAEKNSAEAAKEICDVLGIPSETVRAISEDSSAQYPIRIRPYEEEFADKEYKGYSIFHVANRMAIYLHYHPAVSDVSISFRAWSPPIAYGDVDMNGEIGLLDAVQLQKYLLSSFELNADQLYYADVTQDGVVNGFDLAWLKRILIEK